MQRFGIISLLVALFFSSFAAASLFLSDHVYEGDTAMYTLNSRAYYLRIALIDENQKLAVFELNGERSRPLRERDEHRFSDESVVIVKSIFGKRSDRDLVEFYFAGSGKGMVPVKENVIPSRPGLKIYDEDRCFEDCSDNDPCTQDFCVKNKCVYNTIGFCPHKDQCLNKSQRADGKFCSNEGMQDFRSLGQNCSFNYECESKVCDVTCITLQSLNQTSEAPGLAEQVAQRQGIFERMIRWIKRLF